MYETIVSVIAIIVGCMCTFFPKKMVALSKRTSAKYDDYINRLIVTYPDGDAYKIVLLIGIFFIIIGLVKLFTYHGLI